MTMGEAERRQLDIRVERFSFNTRLKSIFFPIDYSDITEVLREAGFTIPPSLADRTPGLPLGARLIMSGPIAQKDDLRFQMIPDRGIIGIDGRDIERTLDTFNEVEELIRQRLRVDLR